MAELTFKSAGVSTREIDLSGPTAISPQGVPAGVIGTSQKGRAFVPITVATYQDFVAEFGATDGEKFGPLAMNEWMRNARAGTYVKVLGVGNGTQRQSGGDNSGRVVNAGFIVGNRQVQDNGLVGNNAYAGANSATNGIEGRTYFLAALCSQNNGTMLADAGIQTDVAHPILRGVLMAPSGVLLALSSSYAAAANQNDPAANQSAMGVFGSAAINDGGSCHGTVDVSNGQQNFVLILNGHKKQDTYPNVITASFDPAAPQYISKVLNTDPTKIEQAGHLLYSSFDVYPSHLTLTGSGVNAGTDVIDECALLLTGTLGRNVGSATSPNYENWEDRFQTARSPWIISQKFGASNKNLFRVHALDDGDRPNSLIKITIENIQASNNENTTYGKFDLLVRDYTDTDVNSVVLESFRGLSLDPSSERYVSRVVGDTKMYYDFDQKSGAQKLRIEGSHPNASAYIRIEVHSDVENLVVDATALPCGFRGPRHLVTSGSEGASTGGHLEGFVASAAAATQTGFTPDVMYRVVQPPLPMREHLTIGDAPKKRVKAHFTWGIQWEVKDDQARPNARSKIDSSLVNHFKYYPGFADTWRKVLVGDNEGTVDSGGTVLDADRFNNNFFSLERIQVSTGSNDRPINSRWGAAVYRRTGVKAATLTDSDGTVYQRDVTRFLDPSKDFNHLPSRKYLKFTLPVQGGFNGVNPFDVAKSKMTDTACRREFGDAANQGGVKGPTIAAYRKAIDVMEEKADVDIQLLSIPGIRHESVTDYAIDAVEGRFDALLLMDIEEKDTVNEFVTSSADQITDVSNTVERFEARNLDSSFAAAYFPDVVITDPATRTNVQCPPSVAVLGAFALNDAVAHPWFAPAGFTRGALTSVVESQVKLNRSNLDALYEGDVNPITSFPHTPGVVVFGQKTLQAAQSALDRVNVRRLLIEIRRRVRRIANTLLFEPNREETLARFANAVNPVLQRIQAQQGLDRFKVQIDTTTTTQSDVENNTIRGKIFLQPTRAVEFISLDFVVTNQGAEI